MTRLTHVQVRLTHAEKERLTAAAAEQNQSLSEFIRDRCGLSSIEDKRTPLEPWENAVAREIAFDQRVKQLSATVPMSVARKLAFKEGLRPQSS